MDESNESLIDSLRRLRAEEAALSAILVRARRAGNADGPVADRHRQLLGQIRGSIAGKLPLAFVARERLLADGVVHRAHAGVLRVRIAAVRDDLESGALDAAEANASASRLQRQFEQTLRAISVTESQLDVLAGFLPPVPGNPGGADAAATRSEELDQTLSLPSRPADPPPPAPAGWGEAHDAQLALDESDLAPDDLSPEGDCDGDILVEMSRANYKPDSRERRRDTRFSCILPMKYRMEGLTFHGRSSDVSAHGLFIESQSTVPVGTMVTSVFCAEGYPVEIESRVVFESPGVGIGVMFTRIPENDRAYLEAFLHKLMIESRPQRAEVALSRD